MATWTAATAIPTGQLITSAWMTNTVNAVNFLGAAGGATVAKDFAQMRRTTSLSMSGWTKVNFTAEDFDAANGHSVTTDTNRYVAQSSGKYQLSAIVTLSWGTNANPILGIRATKNDVSITGSTVYVNPYSCTSETLVLPPTFVSLSAAAGTTPADYVGIEVINTGGTPSPLVDPTAGGVLFNVVWVGA